MPYKWYHINFTFPSVPLGNGEKKQFEQKIRNIVSELQPNRYFYLYEEEPHAFLAVETLTQPDGAVESNDYDNGEAFLNIMHQLTFAYLFDEINYPHLVHCMTQFQYIPRAMELLFYNSMFKKYEPQKT